MAQQNKIMAIFSYPDDVVSALRALKQEKIKVDTVFSSVPHHEILDTLELKRSPLSYYTLAGAILGIITGFSLSIYSGLQWKFITSGKPVIAWIPFCVEGFEFAILLGVLSTLLGMLINNRMPRVRLPDHYNPQFTRDKFGILLQCRDAEREPAAALLRKAGAEEIHDSF
jgi:molybdopterin-containing oxidoreductase family membrane subunit